MNEEKRKEQQIVEDIKRIGEILKKVPGQDSFGKKEYLRGGGQFSLYQIEAGGKGWRYYCPKAGYGTKEKREVLDEEYSERFRRACNKLQRPPKKNEYVKYGLNCYKRRRRNIYSLFEKISTEIFGGGPGPTTEAAMEKSESVPHVASILNEGADAGNKQSARAPRPVPPIPRNIRGKRWDIIGVDGFPYAPHHEIGVVALFAILCSQGRIPLAMTYVTSGKGIDGICWDEKQQRDIKVEFKKILSSGSFDKPLESFDRVVCWENRWPDFSKPVTELKSLFS